MNPSLHKPYAIELEPSPGHERLHNLRVQYRLGGNWQSFLGVHVPPELLPAICADVEALHLETLQTNGHPQHSLPGRPDYLVVAVASADGAKYGHLPAEYVRAAQRHRVFGVTLMASGLVALPFGLAAAFLGACLFAWGSHEWRTAGEFDCTPFRVNSTYS